MGETLSYRERRCIHGRPWPGVRCRARYTSRLQTASSDAEQLAEQKITVGDSRSGHIGTEENRYANARSASDDKRPAQADDVLR